MKRMTEMSKWQPISTAKKDGNPILATWLDTWPDHPDICAIFWNESRERWCYSRTAWICVGYEPTHWMPLPEPPKEHEA